jgi:hypothetical protein
MVHAAPEPVLSGYSIARDSPTFGGAEQTGTRAAVRFALRRGGLDTFSVNGVMSLVQPRHEAESI